MQRFALLAFAALMMVCLTSSPALCELSLNEIMGDPNVDWDGDGLYDFRDDEWVEVFNAGPGGIDLSEYLLGDGAGLLCYRLTGVLEEGEALVVFGSESQAWQSANGVSSLGFNLSNSGDTMLLLQVDGPDTLIVDIRTFLDHEAEDDRTSGRNPDGTGAWEIFDEMNPYNGANPPFGNGLPPTPGSPNMAGPVATESSTWGRIKAIYVEP